MEPDFEQLFRDAGKAHHEAFIESDGADPDWPIWYAQYLHPRIRHLFKDLTQSELIYHLVGWDKAHSANASDRPWPAYYSDQLRALAKG